MSGIRRGVAVFLLSALVAGCGEEGKVESGSTSCCHSRATPFLEGKQRPGGISIRNGGDADLRVLAFGRSSTNFAVGRRTIGPLVGGTAPRRRFRPFDLKPGEERYVEAIYTVRGACDRYPPEGFVAVGSMPVRFETAGDTHTDDVRLRNPVRFEGSRRCRKRGP